MPFRVKWVPKFIDWLEPTDRCHLNGAAFQNGAPIYMTALSDPFAAEPVGHGWHIRVYLPFAEEFHSLPEADFIRLRPATEADFCLRAQAP